MESVPKANLISRATARDLRSIKRPKAEAIAAAGAKIAIAAVLDGLAGLDV